MIESLKKNEGIHYEKLSPEEMKARGILGRLVGPCADFRKPTRNGRKYSEQLWENVFNDPIMQEKIKNGVCFGELGHPVDRTETDMEKIAICLREQPKKNSEGLLLAVFDILDTPNGRILKTLCDYGSTLAISSRGTGDLITDEHGDEAVDPDTYECNCFDIVLIPGVESARLQYMTESLDSNKKNLKQALCESFEKATEEDKKVMKETLENLNIKIDEDAEEAPAKAEETEEVVISAEGESEVPAEEPEEAAAPEGEEAPEEAPAEEVTFTKEEVEEVATEVAKEVSAPVESGEEAEKQAEEIAETVEEVIEKAVEEKVEETNAEETPTEEEPAKAEEEEPAEEPEGEEVEETEEAEEVVEEEECNNGSCTDKEEAKQPEEKIEEAVNDGDDELLKGLQEALKAKSDLEAQVRELHEQLAVSNTKVNKLTEECSNYKEAAARLSEIASEKKDLDAKVSSLEESLKTTEKQLNEEKQEVARLIKSKQNYLEESKSLNESVSAKEKAYTELNESFNKAKEDYEAQIKTLNEKLTESENSTSSRLATLNESLAKESSLKEGYKKLANSIMNQYIDCKATMLGINAKEIKNRLAESYTLEDVNKVCEDLKAYQLNISRLPISLGKIRSIKVNESVNTNKASTDFDDDDVDEGLIKLSGLRN